MFDKIKFYLLTALATLGAAFMLWLKFLKPNDEIDPAFRDPFEPLVTHHEDELHELDIELNELKENGVDDLTDDEVVDYWSKQ